MPAILIYTKVLSGYLIFYRELNHPNILNFLGIVHDDTKVMLLTNLVTGKNLYQILHEDGMKVCDMCNHNTL